MIPQDFVNQQLRLRFEGVDSAFHVYLNGKEVGYSQGSRNPTEFDVTSEINKTGENTLAVRVYQFCDGSYLEDQDQWRFSGIFRDVHLHAFPKNHIVDFHLQTILNDDYQDARLELKVETHGTGTVIAKLLDKDEKVIAEGMEEATDEALEFCFNVDAPEKWSAESPYLYKLVLTYGGRHIAQNVGFRRIEIKDGIYLVNGKRIVFRGVNRHEHHPQLGRAVPYEYMKRDLVLMKKHNINAIRTCHQPSDPRFYALADQLGFWVMDEADVECHGFGIINDMTLTTDESKLPYKDRKLKFGNRAAGWTSDNPSWKDQYVDRAVQLCQRDKNHPCVVMWSLGNEAFYGCNHQSMYDAIRAIDTTRPIHYEQDFEAKTADLFSGMYLPVAEIIDFAKEPNFKKPLVLCEYIHTMGNGPGNIREYIEAFYEYPRLQGGWAWEWCNHGLKTRDMRSGEEFYAYGGDFGDEPNDYNFILDGMVFSDHTPTPGLTEYKKAIEPVQVKDYNDGKVTLTNRYDTISCLDHLRCEVLLISDGVKKSIGEIAVLPDIQPHHETKVTVPSFALTSDLGETYLQLNFTLRDKTLWASANHLVASSQLLLQRPEPPKPRTFTIQSPTVSSTPTHLSISTSISTFTFHLTTGTLTSWLKHGVQLIHSNTGPHITLDRALTDNDRPQDGSEWRSKLIHLATPLTTSVKWEILYKESTIEVTITQKVAPPVLNWSFDLTLTYTIHSSGNLKIYVFGEPIGVALPATIPRIGFEFSMPKEFDVVEWFGRGPGECYRDSKQSQMFGNWVRSVEELWTEYEFPQEAGFRTDCRWVQFSMKPGVVAQVTNKVGQLLAASGSPEQKGKAKGIETPSLRCRFEGKGDEGFMVGHYRVRDVEEAKHPFELKRKKREEVLVRLDAQHHGLGTGSCGPKTLEKYALKTGWVEFELELE